MNALGRNLFLNARRYCTQNSAKIIVPSQSSNILLRNISSSTGAKSANSSSNNKIKYLAIFGIGAVSFYFLAEKFKVTTSNKKETDGGPLLRIDLNEVYEKTAVLFLSNPEFRETLGMPIKVTSSESDEVRTLNLRREGETMYSFIAYNVEGSKNLGIVYCKLIMDSETQKFKTVSMILKLNKPDKQNRKEIILKMTSKAQSQSNETVKSE